MSGSADSTPVTVAFRRSWVRWWLVAFQGVLPGLIFFGGVVTNSTHGWEKLASGTAMCAFAVLGIRIARLGIFAGPDELVVRDIFRSYRIAWREISAFEMPPGYGAWRKAGLRIHLLDGRLISATLYARGLVDSGGAARTVLQELEQLRHQRVLDAGTAQQLRLPMSERDQPG